MRRLAGLQEARQVMDPDEQDRRYDEQHVREAKIARLIASAFQRIGLAIAEDGIFYQEDADRECNVTLDAVSVDVAALTKLHATGLARRYQIEAADHRLTVVFQVASELDSAVENRATTS